MEFEQEIRDRCNSTLKGYTGTEASKEETLNIIFGITEAAGIILGNSRKWYRIYEEYEEEVEKQVNKLIILTGDK